jgi:hypothetical protein
MPTNVKRRASEHTRFCVQNAIVSPSRASAFSGDRVMGYALAKVLAVYAADSHPRNGSSRLKTRAPVWNGAENSGSE